MLLSSVEKSQECSKGHLLWSLKGSLTPPPTLEAYVYREEMDLAEDPNIRRVQVTSDCLEVVNNINSAASCGKYGMILQDIVQLRNRLEETKFSHERREANTEPHNLAKALTYFDVRCHVWLLEPPEFPCIPMNINMQ